MEEYFVTADTSGMECEFNGKHFFQGQAWWEGCERFMCTKYGIQVQYPSKFNSTAIFSSMTFTELKS